MNERYFFELSISSKAVMFARMAAQSLADSIDYRRLGLYEHAEWLEGRVAAYKLMAESLNETIDRARRLGEPVEDYREQMGVDSP